ncbi:hypothetical protein M2440_004000 [Methylorubrum extorquens]|nr:hypothetical protein [Methylorubrum extorquens]
MVALGANFLLQVGVLLLQALAQGIDFGECGPQPVLVLTALADIAKHDHRAEQLPALADRRRGVLDGETGAILAPEHLAIDLMHGPVAEGRVDRTVVMRVMRTARVGMVDGGVHVLADEIGRGPSQHPLRGRVDEGGDPVRVDAVDPLPRRAQDQPVAALDVAKDALHALPFGQAGAHVRLGLPVDAAALALIEIEEGDEEPRRLARKHAAGIFEAQRLAGTVARREALCPPLPLGEDGLGEHHERGPLFGMQGAHGHRPQSRAVVAEQPGGRRVGVIDAVCQGLEHEHRLAILIEGGAINRGRFQR